MANISVIALNSTQAFVPTPTRIFLTTFYGLLMFMGISGNIMVIVVVFRVKNMLTPTNCYLVSLAVSDLLFFASAGPIELASLNLPRGVYAVSFLVVCRLMTYLPYLSINVSSMTIAAFTFERYIGICHPMKARYLCTVRRAAVTIGIIWGISLVMNCPWVLLATLKPIQYLDLNASSCTFALERSSWRYKFIYVSDFICFYLTPMIFYAIFYGKIAYTLSSGFKPIANWQKSRQEKGAPKVMISVQRPTKRVYRKNSPKDRDFSHLSPSRSRTPSPQKQARHSRDSAVSGGSNKRTQVVKMLFVIMSVFAICWLPYRGLVMYNSFAAQPWQSEAYIYVAKTLIFINCAINPVLYNLMSARFRQAFHAMLTRRRRSGLEETLTWRGTTNTRSYSSRFYSVRNVIRQKGESLRKRAKRHSGASGDEPVRKSGGDWSPKEGQEMAALVPRPRAQSLHSWNSIL